MVISFCAKTCSIPIKNGLQYYVWFYNLLTDIFFIFFFVSKLAKSNLMPKHAVSH